MTDYDSHVNKLLVGIQLIITLNAVSTLSAPAAGASLNFAGVAFAPGSIVRANVPLTAQEKSLAAQGGNIIPQNAVAVLATPNNFDSRRSWPVLVICSTSDFKRQNRDDLADFYRRVGLAEGWVLLAGDGLQHARNDTAAWRGAMTLAAIDALHRSFAASQKWPVACAGFSGGGKGAGLVAPLLARNGCRMDRRTPKRKRRLEHLRSATSWSAALLRRFSRAGSRPPYSFTESPRELPQPIREDRQCLRRIFGQYAT